MRRSSWLCSLSLSARHEMSASTQTKRATFEIRFALAKCAPKRGLESIRSRHTGRHWVQVALHLALTIIAFARVLLRGRIDW